MNPRIFVWNPQSPNIATKFKATFGIPYVAGISGNHTVVIGSVHKLSLHNIPHPYGAFAENFIPENEIICEYTGSIGHGIASDDSYVYRLIANKPEYVDAKTKGNIGRFLNHSDYNNCVFFVQNNKVLIKTIRPIHPGEQMLVNYGPDYWKRIDRIYLDTQHNFYTPQDVYNEFSICYKLLDKVKLSTATKLAIQALHNYVQQKDILVPSAEVSNLPILVKKSNDILEHQLEITWLHVMCYLGQKTEVETLLIDKNFNPDIQCANGKTALGYTLLGSANEAEKIDIIKLIFNNKLPQVLCNADRDKKTIFHYCIENRLNECLKFIKCNTRISLNHLDRDAESLIITAMKSDNLDGLELIIPKMHISDMKFYIQTIQYELNEALINFNNRDDLYSLFSRYGFDLDNVIVSDSSSNSNSHSSSSSSESDSEEKMEITSNNSTVTRRATLVAKRKMNGDDVEEKKQNLGSNSNLNSNSNSSSSSDSNSNSNHPSKKTCLTRLFSTITSGKTPIKQNRSTNNNRTMR